MKTLNLKKFGLQNILLSLLLVFSTSCSFEGVDGLPGWGKFKLVATSSSASFLQEMGVSSATVEVTGIQVRTKGGSWNSFPMTESFQLDFAQLDMGASEVLGRVAAPNGTYDAIRLITAEEGLVTYDDGSTMPLQLPSGKHTGLKVFPKPNIEIQEGMLTIAVMEFDVNHSLHESGDKWVLTPVIQTEVESYSIEEIPTDNGDNNGGTDGNGDGSVDNGDPSGGSDTGSGTDTGDSSGSTDTGDTGSSGDGSTGTGDTSTGGTDETDPTQGDGTDFPPIIIGV